jgi:hypothetical protein
VGTSSRILPIYGLRNNTGSQRFYFNICTELHKQRSPHNNNRERYSHCNIFSSTKGYKIDQLRPSCNDNSRNNDTCNNCCSQLCCLSEYCPTHANDAPALGFILFKFIKAKVMPNIISPQYNMLAADSAPTAAIIVEAVTSMLKAGAVPAIPIIIDSQRPNDSFCSDLGDRLS